MRQRERVSLKSTQVPPDPVGADVRLLTIRQAARLMGVSRLRGYALVRDKILPPGVYVRLGRQVRIDRVALEQFLAKGGAALSGGWRRRDVQ
jgi:excisionase family DNA binding protein